MKAVYDRAIADFTQAIRLDPNNAKAYRERGLAYNNKGDYDGAIGDCTQAQPESCGGVYQPGLGV
jgi:Flp pilus assembly protein TadD